MTGPPFLCIIIVVRIYLMNQDKLKLIIRNLESLVECLKSEVYSDIDAYKAENYDDSAHYHITDYDEVFDDDDDGSVTDHINNPYRLFNDDDGDGL